MNTLLTLIFIINTIYIFVFNDAITLNKNQQKLILRGRVIYPGGSKIPIESDGILTVQLQDTSLADAPARIISTGSGRAVRFPMAFAIKYSPSQVSNAPMYSIQVTIKNKKNELLYINDMHIGVTPLGINRTKFIDVPVILVKKPTKPTINKQSWPELVGTKGQDAVKIIKQETGFTNVVIVKEGSVVTLDYRTDRVRVFVDNKGIVTSVPMIG